MKKEMNIQEADKLLEKYYEGMTSVKEEKQIIKFLSQKELPAKFDADKALLGYFAAQKTNQTVKNTHIIPLIRWASIAAAILATVFTTDFLLTNNSKDYVYVNGKRYTDNRLIKENALSTIKELSDYPDEIKASTKLLDNNLIEEQIDLLANIN